MKFICHHCNAEFEFTSFAQEWEIHKTHKCEEGREFIQMLENFAAAQEGGA